MENYSEFYTKLIDIWKHGGKNGAEGGWAGYYYGVFSDIINKNNFKNCAEVGIGYGFHAREILENTTIDKLYLIDPMCYYPNDGFVKDVFEYGGFELLVKNITKHLNNYNKRYTWFKQPSTTITNKQIPDGSLDAIFLDADNSYQSVTQDLEFWWKKIKVGGWLLGDDYNSCHPGTEKAVNEFALKYNFKLEFLYKSNREICDYPIYKFVKQ
jgi:hypothetical protein